ncbi:PREDICTED: uncharacterized protein LOC108556776 isoform X2 [Nicrophorus vespilloides]|uniref:Uncharacterized protein LOC108556776 isoform X2 n=1 Tax=Nicrophorus vespilloides TaxID=110193 RepID=A0ABM1M1S8_NICVS|nr:PREDICTED: uncharacterized protein LOC108556776 isoform X2 [Nicrophorus vespilloides]
MHYNSGGASWNGAQSATSSHQQQTPSKAANGGVDIGPKKTAFIVFVVVACFAVLWPKVFYPMMFGTTDDQLRPNAVDKSAGCCDVFSDSDVTTIKIIWEMCDDIIIRDGKGRRGIDGVLERCRSKVMDTCGIDVGPLVSQGRARADLKFGTRIKRILQDLRTLNGSLCLKHNFGLDPQHLGVGHKVTADYKATSVRQERPPHLRAEMLHPAFKERGSAIPRYQSSSSSSSPPVSGGNLPKAHTIPKGAKLVEGRPGPIPGMRPPMGGAGHVVPPSQKAGSMGIIMPIYTVAIVVFFTYTLIKLLCKKQPDGAGGALYPPVEPDPQFRRDVFESERCKMPAKRDQPSSKIGDDELDQLRRRLRETEVAMERIVAQMAQVPLGSGGGGPPQDDADGGRIAKQKHPQKKEVEVDEEEEQPQVKVVGMETRASCEGGQRWSSNQSVRSVLPTPPPPLPRDAPEPPKEIFLEGALPAQSQLLVADAKIETQSSDSEDDPAVVLAGKMTLSVISLDTAVDERENEDDDDDDEADEEMNGDDELLTESKYTTVSSGTAAEHEVSDDDDDDDDEAITDNDDDDDEESPEEQQLIEDIDTKNVKAKEE